MNGLAYVMVVLGILVAKGLGFFRDIVFASVFGASVHTDMYFQIFGLVNLIFTGIGVALSTLVIKNLNKAEHSSEILKRGYVSYFIRKTTLVSVIAAVCMAIMARPITEMLLPGLDAENTALAVKLMYIMLPSFVFVIIAYIIYAEVLRENTYLSRTIEVQENQTVIDTGLYGIIRHPMYFATLLLFLSIPLILGSLYSFIIFLAYPFIISKRIKNEEKLLLDELEGYSKYTEKVKFRLIPFIW